MQNLKKKGREGDEERKAVKELHTREKEAEGRGGWKQQE